MKNKIFYTTIIAFSILILSSCAGSRSYGSHRKGYGCPNSSSISTPGILNNNV